MKKRRKNKVVDLLNKVRGEDRDGYKMYRPVVFRNRKKYDRKNVARLSVEDYNA